MTPIAERYLKKDGKYNIDIKLSDLRQLFNVHDPAPFRERDLDDDAVSYIVESIKEIKIGAEARLVVHLPQEKIEAEDQQKTSEAIHNYFTFEEDLALKRMKTLLKQGEYYFLVGLVFLFSCAYLSYTILSLRPNVVTHIIGEGLNIIGWVAMWRPIEILLYDWRPLRKMQRYYQKLKQIEVQIVPLV